MMGASHDCPVQCRSAFSCPLRGHPPTLTLPLEGGGNYGFSAVPYTSPLEGEVGAERRVGGWRAAPKKKTAARRDDSLTSPADGAILRTVTPALSRGPSRSLARADEWFPARCRVRDDDLWGCAGLRTSPATAPCHSGFKPLLSSSAQKRHLLSASRIPPHPNPPPRWGEGIVMSPPSVTPSLLRGRSAHSAGRGVFGLYTSPAAAPFVTPALRRGPCRCQARAETWFPARGFRSREALGRDDSLWGRAGRSLLQALAALERMSASKHCGRC